MIEKSSTLYQTPVKLIQKNILGVIYKERVDYLALPDSYAFQVRFRLDKESTEQLLLEIHPQHYKSNRN